MSEIERKNGHMRWCEGAISHNSRAECVHVHVHVCACMYMCGTCTCEVCMHEVSVHAPKIHTATKNDIHPTYFNQLID